MNIIRTLLALAFCATAATAQEPVTTGAVTGISRALAGITVIPGSSQQPVHFRELHRARMYFGSGRRATFDDLREGQVITIHYAQRGGRWYVSRVVIPDPRDPGYQAAPSSGLTVAESRALRTKVANDGDITTHPGTRARIEGDITRQPGRTLPGNTDITRRPDNR